MLTKIRTAVLVGLGACALPSIASAQQPLQLLRLGSEFQVNTNTVDFQYYPAVGMDARGNFAVTWGAPDVSNSGIFGQRFDRSGARVGTEFQVNTYASGFQDYGTIALDGDGDFVVAWVSYGQDGDGSGVFAQRFSSSGSIVGTEFLVSTYTFDAQREVVVSAEPNGDFVVVWNSYSNQDGDLAGIFAQRFASSGGAVGTEFQVNSYTPSKQYEPSVSLDSDGDFIVAWGDYYGLDGDSKGAFGQRYTSSGAPSGAQFQVNSYTVADQGAYEGQVVDSELDGDFVVVWGSYYQDGEGAGVFGQRFARSGARIGTEFLVNSYTAGAQGGFFGETVAVDELGNFLVVWSSDGQDLFGQGFSSAGVKLGTEFQVNTQTVGQQRSPVIAGDVDGDFVVVWESEANGGIIGRRFVFAYELDSQAVGAGGSFGTETGEGGDGASANDRVETTVTSPNAGTVTVAEKPSGLFPIFGYALIGQLVDITAPPATAGSPLRIVFELDRSLFAGNVGDPNVQVYRNLVGVPDCPGIVSTCSGGPTMAAPDPCVASRCLQGDLDAQITVLTSSASDWGFAAPCTTGFAKGLFLVKENAPGKEKLIAKLIGGPALTQEDFGNPLAIGGTSYRLRVYDDAQTLVADLPVERAGDTTCSGGATSCWKALGGAPPDGKGYKYKDSDATPNGVTQLMLKSSASTKLLFKAKGPAPPFTGGIAPALASTTAVTIEVHGIDAPAGCFATTLSDIKTQEPDAFKAK